MEFSPCHKGIVSVAVVAVILCLNIKGTLAADCSAKFKMFKDHTACLDKSPDSTSIPPSTQEKASIVNEHNDFRRNVAPPATNMLKMVWDEELAMLAQNWADTCPSGHDTNLERYIPGRYSVGQNMGEGQSDFTAVINDWHSEVSDYTFGKSSNDHRTDSLVIGHYTQVVWAGSGLIGCGRSLCGGRNVYVCNYGPAGNVGDFSKPYEDGTRAAQCQTNQDGLCDCGGMVCENNSVMDTSQCTCTCGVNTNTGDSCALNCNEDDNAICGSGSWAPDACNSSLVASIALYCPKQCNLCPYALSSYQEVPSQPETTSDPGGNVGTTAGYTSDTTEEDPTTTSSSGSNDSETTTDESENSDETTTDGDDDDKDNGASMNATNYVVILWGGLSLLLCVFF